MIGADLFCGAGGLTEGLEEAAAGLGIDMKVIAINHWQVAITTHRANHPDAHQVLASLTDEEIPEAQARLFSLLDVADPRKTGPRGRLRILTAAPECTHHSNARGGKPRSDQSRASAWCILRWVEAREPRSIVIENVPEFVHWGPLGSRGKPLKSRKGETFKAFLRAMEALNYRVEWRVLTCADYGDATTRRRLFVRAERGRRAIAWPDRSHAPVDKCEDLGLQPWRPARDIIDWGIPGNSIFLPADEARLRNVRRPLSSNTLRRIAVGIEKYWGEWAEPFLVLMYGTNDVRDLDRPLPAVTAQGQHIGLARPFLVAMNYTGSAEHDGRYTRDDGQPVPTITSQGNRFGLARALLVPQNEGGRTRECSRPLPTVLTRGAIGLVEPFVVPQRSTAEPRSVDRPLQTVTTTSRGIGVCAPFLVPQFGERQGQAPRTRGVEDPLPSVTSHGAGAVVRPFLLKYYGTAGARSAEVPLDSVTTRDRFAVVEPGIVRDEQTGELYALDIRFRMLAPQELAAAHSFPAGYTFTGTREEQVKQIGNSVPVRTARALCHAALSA